jgi:alkylation response protein AidB-like acyl-CoA dehydrogenase
MNFAFNEEQKSLADTVGQRLADFPGLTAPEPVETETTEVWQALAELGLFALLVPEADGGVGLSFVDLALAAEALGAGLAPPIVSSTLIATDIIAQFGSDSQKAELLPAIASGELKVAVATVEPGGDYAPDDVTVSIGGGRISGSKILVAGAKDANAYLVLARNEGRPALALVHREARGVSTRRHADIDGASGLGEVIFDDASLGDDALIAHKEPGPAVERLFQVAPIVYALMEMGIAGRMLDTAVEYAKTRMQFGRPIGAFQSIKHRCADMAVAVEAGRSAAYYAAWAVSEQANDADRASSMAKAYCGEVARDVCNEAIQIHGGMGFTWELGLHRFLRRAKVLEHGFGDHTWHYERVVATTLASASQQHDAALVPSGSNHE